MREGCHCTRRAYAGFRVECLKADSATLPVDHGKLRMVPAGLALNLAFVFGRTCLTKCALQNKPRVEQSWLRHRQCSCWEGAMIRANCRARFTVGDFDFIVRTLAHSRRASVS